MAVKEFNGLLSENNIKNLEDNSVCRPGKRGEQSVICQIPAFDDYFIPLDFESRLCFAKDYSCKDQ